MSEQLHPNDLPSPQDIEGAIAFIEAELLQLEKWFIEASNTERRADFSGLSIKGLFSAEYYCRSIAAWQEILLLVKENHPSVQQKIPHWADTYRGLQKLQKERVAAQNAETTNLGA